jgi:hypothetical protein
MNDEHGADKQPHGEEIIRLGVDEMNLVEYPFASLWNKEEPGAKIEHEWEAQHPVTGRMVKAIWRATGDPEIGLPGPSEERIYLALMELSRERGLEHQSVSFTRYDLLKRLNWPDNRNCYQMLLDGFRRLRAVSITSENAFWDASIKSFRNVGFGIIDNYDIVAEPPGRKRKEPQQNKLPLSYFRWNDVIFGSVQAGYIRALDVGFALSLKGDTALRLFRYLDKKAYGGRKGFEIELAGLCERHLGMKPTRYDSTRKARLKSAHDELLERGFLREVSFAPMKTRKAEKACYAFGLRHGASASRPAALPEASAPSLEPPPAVPVPEARPGGEDVESALLKRMAALGVSADVAGGFAAGVPPEELALQLDCLGDRKANDAAAVFVKSVREKWAIPQAHLDRVEARQRAEREQAKREAARASKAHQEIERRERSASQEQESARLDGMWERLGEAERGEIDRQASQRLGVLGQPGRAQGALMAMRRNLLRERLPAQFSLEPQESPDGK